MNVGMPLGRKKMALLDIFKVTRKTFFNPTKWIDYESIRDQTNTIKEIAGDLYKKPTPARKETFEQAMKRLNLTEEDVADQISAYQKFTIIFTVCAVLVFFYSFYLLFRYWAFGGWILGLAVTILFLSQAFRFDFWRFQMVNRRLGMKLEDWKNARLGRSGKSHD